MENTTQTPEIDEIYPAPGEFYQFQGEKDWSYRLCSVAAGAMGGKYLKTGQRVSRLGVKPHAAARAGCVPNVIFHPPS